MSTIGIYNEPQDILFKMLREGRRAFISIDENDRCDGLYNFCVTAHSLRDWCIKYLSLSEPQKTAFHAEMNTYQYFPECRDIANSSKHFSLSSGLSSVTSALPSTEEFAVLVEGGHVLPDTINRPSITITLSDSSMVSLFGFLHHVATNWITVLNNKQIPLNPGFTTLYMFIEQR